jgi:hypothetical protein
MIIPSSLCVLRPLGRPCVCVGLPTSKECASSRLRVPSGPRCSMGLFGHGFVVDGRFASGRMLPKTGAFKRFIGRMARCCM